MMTKAVLTLKDEYLLKYFFILMCLFSSLELSKSTRKCPCYNGEICEAVEAEWTVLTTEEFKGYFEEEE